MRFNFLEADFWTGMISGYLEIQLQRSSPNCDINRQIEVSMQGDELQERTRGLEDLARASFGTLNIAELKLLRVVPSGELAYFGPSARRDDPANDPTHADNWGPEREIRADLIRWLCIDRHARDRVPPSGIQILGATGRVNLSHVTVPFPLALGLCALADEVEMNSADIPALNLWQSWIRSFNADQARVRESLLLRGIRIDGILKLAHAQIGGNLSCDDAVFMGSRTKDPLALYADHIVVGGSFFLRNVSAQGEVRLLGAQIGGNLECDRGQFRNPRGNALSADGMIVKGEVFLRHAFHAEGEVRLVNAQVGGDLECEGGSFSNPPGSGRAVLGGMGTLALRLDGISVKGSVRLGDDFRAEGLVQLETAHIGGDLDTQKGVFQDAILDLKDASVGGTIIDDEQSWPHQGRLYLDGFAYARIGGTRDARSRLRWLGLQPRMPFVAQPYRLLANILRDAGDGDGAVIVLVEMERRRRESEYRTLTAQVTSWVVRETTGYGYEPMRSVWAIAGLSALGWIIYRRSYLAGSMVPTEKDAYQSFRREGKPPTYYRAFAPLVYSLENSLPVVKLGQADQWQPDPNLDSELEPPRKLPTMIGSSHAWTRLRWLQRALVSCGFQPDSKTERAQCRLSQWGTSSRFVRWFLWIQVLLGWILATLFIYGLTESLRKQ